MISVWIRAGIANVMLDTAVPLPGPKRTETWLDGVALREVLGRDPDYRLAPRLGRRRRGHCIGVGTAIAADVLEAIPWFDRYTSPAASLELLRRGQTSWGRARSAATAELTAYLEMLCEDEPLAKG